MTRWATSPSGGRWPRDVTRRNHLVTRLRWPTFLGQLRHPTGCDIKCSGDISDRPSGADKLAGGFLGARNEDRGDLGGPVPFDAEVNGGLQSGELRVVEHQVDVDR